MELLYRLIWYFFVYAVLGWCLEMAYAAVKNHYFVNRGFLNGPICPIYGFGVVAVVVTLMPYKENLFLLYAASTIVVTVIEGMTGFVMDKIFHHRWWDYSKVPLNIGGYVCLRFSLIWGVFCVFIVKVFHPIVEMGIGFIPLLAGRILLILLMIAGIADTYVTASAILKLNKKLAAMERIAEELHAISEKMGEEIFESVIEAERKKRNMDKRADVHLAYAEQTRREVSEGVGQVLSNLSEGMEEKRQAMDQAMEETKIAMEETKQAMDQAMEEKRLAMEAKKKQLEARYRELLSNRSKVGARLVKAFPDMRFRDYNEQLSRLKTLVRAEKTEKSAKNR